MAKGKKKTSRWWIIALFVVGVLVLIYGTSKNNKPQQKESLTAYLIYQSPTYKFSIAYPQAWEVKNDTQVFENGDAVAFQIKGPTQKRYTEFIDGARFIVSKPFSIDTDITTWAKGYFTGNVKFTKSTFTGRRYEEVEDCSNWGCMRYFFTMINNKVYGVATFAEGGSTEKAMYENALFYMFNSLKFTDAPTAQVTKGEAIAKVKLLSEVADYLKRVPNGLVAVNGEEDNWYLVQVYEIVNGHTATFNWYNVNKTTGTVEKQF